MSYPRLTFSNLPCRLHSLPGSSQYKHIKYWLGLYVKDDFPDMDAEPHAELISPYFKQMKELLVAGILMGDVDVASLHNVTAKSLFTGYTSSFPPPKVELKYEVDWSCVWKRVHSPMFFKTMFICHYEM